MIVILKDPAKIASTIIVPLLCAASIQIVIMLVIRGPKADHIEGPDLVRKKIRKDSSKALGSAEDRNQIECKLWDVQMLRSGVK